MAPSRSSAFIADDNRRPWPVPAFRAALAVALITTSYLAFTPRHFPVIDHIWDKLKHAAAFVTLATLADFSFPRSRFGAAKAGWLLAYGVLIEVVQYFVPYRSAEVLDVVADSVGIACYLLLVPALRRLPLVRERWRLVG